MLCEQYFDKLNLFLSFSAFIIFCSGEYAIVGLNSAFWAVVLVEFNRDFAGFKVVSIRAKKGTDKIVPETPPLPISCNDKATY